MTGGVVAASAPSAPPLLVVVGANSFIKTSADGGVTWVSRATAIQAAGWGNLDNITSVVWIPSRNRIWVGGSGGAYAYSDNAGVSWTVGSVVASDVNFAAYSPVSDLLIAAVASSSIGARSSTDGGINWFPLDYDAGSATLPTMVRFTGGRFVIPTGSAGAIRHSVNGLTSWTNSSCGVTVALVDVVATNSRWVAVGVGQARSSDTLDLSTTSWNSNLTDPGAPRSVATDGSVVVSANDDRTVYRLAGGATTWDSIDTGGSMSSNDDFVGIVWSPTYGKFFIFSEAGWFGSSVDGTTWTGLGALGAVTTTAGAVCVCE